MNIGIITRVTYASLLLALICLGLFLSPTGEPDFDSTSKSEIVFRGFPSDLAVSAEPSIDGVTGKDIPLGTAYQPIPKANIRNLGENFTLVFSRDGFHSNKIEFKGKQSQALLSSETYPPEDPISLNPESTLSLLQFKFERRWPWLTGGTIFLLLFLALFFKQDKMNQLAQALLNLGAGGGIDKYVGTTVSDYKIIRPLGAGAWGKVYEAIPISKLGKKDSRNYRVAIKFYDLEDFLDSPANRERFSIEGQALKGLDHPNIVHFVEAGEIQSEIPEERRPYLILEYISGKALDEYVVKVVKEKVKEGDIEVDFEKRVYFKIPPRQILDWMGPVVEALEYAHAKKIVHRDLKPANIKIDDDGRPVLLDFGLSRLSTSTYTKTGTTMGTPAYAPPELSIDAKDAIPASDQFSFGVMVYHMLTAQHPFGDSEGEIWTAIVMQNPPKPLEGYDDELQAVLFKMMAYQPDDRYPSVRDGYKALEEALKPWL